MADVQTLIDRNREFAGSFDQGDLAILPRLSTLVLTCLDARVDPAHLFGLELGDAVVMRNIGGRVTDEVIEQIAILRALAGLVGGGALEVVIIHHTDCGASDRKACHHRPADQRGRGRRPAPGRTDSTGRPRRCWLRL